VITKKDTYSKFFLKKTVGSNPTKAALLFGGMVYAFD
jgi:hypothetical protein